MMMRTIPRENITPGCHESFLPKNCTMIEREDHPQLEMLVESRLVDGLYLSTTMVVDFLVEVVMGLQKVVVMVLQKVAITILQKVAVVDPQELKIQDCMLQY
jgi:hypothetical protein